MTRHASVARETVISAQTNAEESITTVIATVQEINGVPLQFFDELLVMLEVTTAMIGAGATMDILLQRAVKPNPVSATDADWDDYFHFTQITPTTALAGYVAHLPFVSVSAGTDDLGSSKDHIRAVTGTPVAAGGQAPGHWGDYLRIVEINGASEATTQAVYSIHMTGIIH